MTDLKASSVLKGGVALPDTKQASPISLVDGQGLFIDEGIYPLAMPGDSWDGAWINGASLVQMMQGVWATRRQECVVSLCRRLPGEILFR